MDGSTQSPSSDVDMKLVRERDALYSRPLSLEAAPNALDEMLAKPNSIPDVDQRDRSGAREEVTRRTGTGIALAGNPLPSAAVRGTGRIYAYTKREALTVCLIVFENYNSHSRGLPSLAGSFHNLSCETRLAGFAQLADPQPTR
jgi:hypothetical protein